MSSKFMEKLGLKCYMYALGGCSKWYICQECGSTVNKGVRVRKIVCIENMWFFVYLLIILSAFIFLFKVGNM